MIPLVRQQPGSCLYLISLALILFFSTLQGQGFWVWNLRTHAELDWQAITTEHFNIYYHQGLEDVAWRGATIAEQIYQPVMDQLQVTDFGRTDMVFTAEDEIMNGYAMPSNQIFIWAYQNDAAGWFMGSEKWLKAVIAHEFQHVVLMNGLKTWLGTLNLLMVPGWFIEGTAEYYTEKWRVGRSDSQMKIHTYKNRMNRLDSHDSGYAKVLYLADKYGDSTITKLVHYRDELKIGERKLLTLPYLFGRAFKKITGQSVAQFDEEWRRTMNTYYYSYRGQKEGVDEVGEPVVIPNLTSIQGLAISPDSSRVAVVGRASKEMRDWSLYTVSTDSTHRRVELHYGQYSGNPAWSPDGKTIAISGYRRGRHGSLLWDIRLIDVERGNARWLTSNARATDPAWSPDGRYILYAAHPGMTTNLYITDPSGDNTARLTTFTGDVQLQDPQWSPDGSQIVFAVQEEDGDVDVAVVRADGKSYRKLTSDPGEDLAPLWSADGQWILFTSFRNSTPNLYRVPAAGGEIVPVTDVAEGIYTAQIMPGTGEVVAMTLGDVDTVRVRRLPMDRSVADSDPPIMREKFTRWRDGQPGIPVPSVDLTEVPSAEGPRPYRSWGTWRPLARLILPDFYGIGALGVWQDALGKNQLILAGEALYQDRDWGGYASWTSARFAPFLTLSAYRDFKFRIRGYGSGYLLEEVSGMEVGTLYPFNLGHRLTSEHLVAINAGGFDRRPVEGIPVDTTGALGLPVDVREGRISFLYQWKSQRPHRAAGYLPPGGTGFRLRYDHYTTVLFGDFQYGKGEAEVFAHRNVPKTPLVVFARLAGAVLTGTWPRQDGIGLLTDSPVYLNPGSALGLLGEFIEAPELHSLRGLTEPKLGNRVVSGTLELRLPLVEESLVQVLGLGLGQFTAALFADFGQVWDRGSSAAHARFTHGVEVKGNIVIGSFPLLTLAYGQAGDQEAWQQCDPLTYLRLGLVSPF
ncbi:MAG: PD40 domain-containing protein [Fidelibacterota bacterium]|nr:MAG: PD40 domain-containing protein [Candidatus Neomarinimicrobiota bacterium]